MAKTAVLGKLSFVGAQTVLERMARDFVRHRHLLWQFLQRDVSVRYQGTFFGLFWSFLSPLIMLAVYVFVFGFVFKASFRHSANESTFEFGLALFCGLNLFNLFAEVVLRSPTLILQHPNFVKKVVFPLEILPVVATAPKIDGTIGDPVWHRAAKATLAWDFNHQRIASQPTEVYVLAGAADLYVAFVAHQTETITATQRTNDVPMPGDDVVRVYFWPGGTGGFEYGFISNPAGTRFEFSDENNLFAPHWASVSSRTAGGYIVTMRIPLNAMRASAATWFIQFDRRVHETNELFEWAHASAQDATDDERFAGLMRSPVSVTAAARTKPRIAIYTLGQTGASSAGGSTSRTGVDLALPVTATASHRGRSLGHIRLCGQSAVPWRLA